MSAETWMTAEEALNLGLSEIHTVKSTVKAEAMPDDMKRKFVASLPSAEHSASKQI